MSGGGGICVESELLLGNGEVCLSSIFHVHKYIFNKYMFTFTFENKIIVTFQINFNIISTLFQVYMFCYIISVGRFVA